MLNRPGARFLIVGFLALMMAVPLFLVGSIIDGRLSASRDVQDRVSREWGGSQTLSGPRLVVPVRGPVVQTVSEMMRDPQTGQPITHKLVSVTVIAPTALEADGWDTGLMVLGPEKAQQVVREEGLAVYMIVKEGEGFKTWMSPQFRTFLVGEKN